jgi:hypothetical protein
MPRRLTIDTGEWGDEPLRAREQLERRVATSRPFPPESTGEQEPETFVPDLAFAEWIIGTFINASGPLANEDHAHLVDARFGVLWTNCINVRQHRHVLASAELPQTQGSKWKKGRADQQLREWFGAEVDFVLTFYAPECEALDDRAFCALVEHELYHCAQAEGPNGPKFDPQTGQPIYDIRGHDVEEFVGVARRYGITSREVRQLVDAINAGADVPGAAIEVACGTGKGHALRIG